MHYRDFTFYQKLQLLFYILLLRQYVQEKLYLQLYYKKKN